MKIKLITDSDKEEEIIIYVRKETELIKSIIALVENYDSCLTGYRDREVVRLNSSDVFVFTAQDNRVYAVTERGSYRLKEKLYQLEEKYSDFVKINQSCLVNTAKIEKFDVSFSGTMKVILKNGYTDYVSRRNLKSVKERFGI